MYLLSISLMGFPPRVKTVQAVCVTLYAQYGSKARWEIQTI